MIFNLDAPQEISEEKRVYYSEVIKNKPYNLELLPPEVRDDKELMLLAVETDGYSLKFASDRLKDDEEVALAAMTNLPCYEVFCAASDRLNADKDFVLKCIGMCEREDVYHIINWMLGSMTGPPRRPDWSDDKDVMLLAVQRGRCLSFASPRLRDDKEVVMASLCHWGSTLTYASDRLQSDRELVLQAAQYWWTLRDVDPKSEFRDDKEIVMKVVQNYASSINGASPRLQVDRDVVLAAVRQDNSILLKLPESWKDDPEVMDILRGK